jgi:hypothetical protein
MYYILSPQNSLDQNLVLNVSEIPQKGALFLSRKERGRRKCFLLFFPALLTLQSSQMLNLCTALSYAKGYPVLLSYEDQKKKTTLIYKLE